ncbi:MAG: polyprenyl synthetase family protein [Desulfobacteraceae bacterium]
MDPEPGRFPDLGRDLELINAALDEHLKSRVELAEKIAAYSVLGEGKRLRPVLFVLCSRLCGCRGEDVYRYSVIFEYVHAASLLHDDVLDNADLRRNKPSAARVWGNHAAVLGGDFLNARAFELCVECRSLELMEMLAECGRQMAEAQMLELANTQNWEMTRDLYMEVITGKTAALISAACACGGIMAGAGESEVGSLRRFGLHLGIAFQLIDDLLDYTSTEEVFGKPVGKDLREGKITLPLILAMEGMDRGMVGELSRPFKTGQATEEDYKRIIKLVRHSGGLADIRAEARVQAELAARELEVFPDSRTRRDLLALNSYLLSRSF